MKTTENETGIRGEAKSMLGTIPGVSQAPRPWRRSLLIRSLLGVFCAVVLAQAWALSKGIYQNDFSSTAVDQVPEDFLILNGTFSVKEENGNRFLELPGEPLDSFGLLFGMTGKDGLQVSGRGLGTGKGRRFPTFGFGLNGAGGYRIQVSPAKKQVELFKGDHACAAAPFEWQSGRWTRFKLQVVKPSPSATTWKVRGKAWPDGVEEPKAWAIVWEEKEEPVPGRASLWGSPFANTAIRFDDLRVEEAQAE